MNPKGEPVILSENKSHIWMMSRYTANLVYERAQAVRLRLNNLPSKCNFPQQCARGYRWSLLVSNAGVNNSIPAHH
jgi:hypothetical protein